VPAMRPMTSDASFLEMRCTMLRDAPSTLPIGRVRIHAGQQCERGHSGLVNFLQIAAALTVRISVGDQNLGEPPDNTELVLEIVTNLVILGHILEGSTS